LTRAELSSLATVVHGLELAKRFGSLREDVEDGAFGPGAGLAIKVCPVD
jgi:hypothetical protein